MATRRTRVLAAVAVLGCLLLAGSVILVREGVTGDRDGLTVAGIVLGLGGLVCLRVLYWARRIRLMTQAGLALHVDDESTDEGTDS